MKFNKTVAFGIITAMIGFIIYYFEFIQKEQIQNEQQNSMFVIKSQPQDINFLQIQNNKSILTLQKNNQIWQIIEPIQDQADQVIMTDLIKNLSEQKTQNIETATDVNLSEFGLEQPQVVYLWKSSTGQSEKIQISSQKNFEGQSFAKISDELKVRIVDPIWMAKAESSVTFFREKKLYRGDISKLNHIKIKSLNEEFVLKKNEQKWIYPKSPEIELDQNKIRKMIKDFSEATIQNYISEGEASEKDLKIKGLLKPLSQIEFANVDEIWNVSLNLSETDKALYGLTSKPSFLIQLDISQWEKFANANLDSLRDRKSLMTFSITDVQKFFAKIQNINYEFLNENQTWNLKSNLPENNEFLPIESEKILNQIHDLEISEFVAPELAKNFDGKNMVILKSANDQLIFQLNWGPLVNIKSNGLEKEVYLARTQLSKNIFAIDKNKIDDLNLNRVFKIKAPVPQAVKND